MTFVRHLGIGRLAALLVLPLLAACASSDAKIYTLTAEGGGRVAGRPVSISIETVDVAKYLDRPQLVRRSSSVQLNVSEFERWGEPFGSMVQRVLAENLRLRLPAGSLVTTSQTVTGKEASTLEVSVNRFDLDDTGMVVLQAQWRLHYRTGASGAAAQANISVRPAGSDTAAQIQAMSQALDQLAARVAQRLG